MTRLIDVVLFPFSRTFALWYLGFLAALMALFTFRESLEVNPPTPFPWYLSWWFFAILGVGLVNICGVFFRPDMLRIQRWPNLFTHFGLVFVLVGGFLTHWLGEDGFVQLREGEGRDFFWSKTSSLVLERGNLRRRVALGDLADLDGRTVRDPKGTRYVALEGLSAARMGPGGPEPDPTGRGRGAVRIRPAKGGEAVWLIEEADAVAMGETRLRLTRRRPMGFKLSLIKATEVRWPASTIPLSFYSRVRVDDADRSLTREWQIETNDPLYYRGWRFYQSGMGGGARGAPSSTFQVSRDPGVVWVTIGICMFGLGILVLFALRFVRDPLQARRVRRVADAREAGQEEEGELMPPPPLAPGGAS